MLSKKNFLLIIATIFCLSSAIVAQSFSWSGPTNLTINYGQTTASAAYYFTYNNLSGLCYPGLIIAVNGNVINNDLCHNPSTPSSYTINFTEGTHTVKFSLLSINCNTLNCYHAIIHKVYEFTVTVNFKIRHENIFTYGTIYVDNYTTPRNSPYDRTSNPNNSYSIGAIDQSYGGYNWIWNNSGINNSKWKRITSDGSEYNYSYDRNTNYTVQPNDKNAKLIAGLRKICNIIFQNNYVGLGNGGIITVNGSQYNSPTSSFQVVELNPITAEAVDQSMNGINYTFTQWSDQNQNRSRTIYPSDHQTYTAYFRGIPQPPTIAVNLTQNQPIRLTWTANPNGNVIYKIHRDIHHRATGWTHGWHIIATLPAGSNSYTDGDYIYGWGSNSYYLYYKVEAFYTIENTSSISNMISTEGYDNVPKISLNIPTEYGITSFPNPFNPTTTFLYKLVDDSDVLLEVYDITGKLVDRILNEHKQSGYHSVVWNTSNINGENLSSGMYLYRFTVKPTNGKNIYIKNDKLILMK
mgnify:CR=1 FL=1